MSGGGEVEFDLAPQEGYVLLQRANGGQVITSLETGCWVKLAEAPEPWELSFAENGHGFVSSGDSSIWCADVLEQSTYIDGASGDRCIIDDKGCAVSLSIMSKRKFDSVVSFSEGRRPLASLPVVVACLSQDGVLVWWSLPDVHRSLCLDAQKGCAHRWCEHGWDRWSSFVEKEVQLPTGHLRKKWQGDAAHASLESGGLAEFRCASTCALLALLVRWVSLPAERGGLGHASDKAKGGLLLDAMLAKFFNQPLAAWTVFRDEGCRWQGAAWPVGRRPLDIAFADGAADLRPMVDSRCHLCKSLIATLTKRGIDPTHPIGLKDLLLNAMAATNGRASSAHFWFVKQLLSWVGRVIDRTCADAMKAMSSPPKLPATVTSRQKDLMRYWLASREAFDRPPIVHVALDASNLAEKGTTAGLVALPSNIAVVFPPQVFGQIPLPPWFKKQCA